MDAREKLIAYMKKKFKEERKNDKRNQEDKKSSKRTTAWAIRDYDWS